MRPHFSVHRRCHQNRRASRKRDRSERMARQTVRQLSDDVRCRRRNQKKVGAIRQFNVTRPPIFFFIEEARHHRIFGKRLQSERRDELGRVVRHDRENLVALLYQ